MANIITLVRLLLLVPLVVVAYTAAPQWQLFNAPLLIVIILLDAVDGYVARKRNETSLFGSIVDIAADRVVENVLWLVLAHLNLVPVWVAIVFIVRGSLVDSIRYPAMSKGETAFGMMRTPFGRFLVASRFMRGLYGTVKAVTWAWVLFTQPWPQLFPELWGAWRPVLTDTTDALVFASVALCLIRAVPVVAEFVAQHSFVPKAKAADGVG